MTQRPQALPPFDDLGDSLDQSVRIPPLLPPLSLVAVPRPSPLEPSARVDAGNGPTSRLDIRTTSKADSNVSRTHAKKDGHTLPTYIDPADLKDGSRKPQKLDFFQLPKPNTSSSVTSNPSAFPHIPLLSGLREPPPSVTLFPPITPKQPRPPKFDVAPVKPPTTVPTDSVEIAEQPDPVIAKSTESKRQNLRGRRVWTEQETKDLLKGVEAYGIGKWKLILKHDGFNFHSERSAVDLKDRYRTYQKGKDRLQKHRRPQKKQHIQTEKQSSQEKSSSIKENDMKPPENVKAKFEISTVSDLKEQLANAPQPGASKEHPLKFARWTATEDSRLVQANRKHGFKWTTIAQDRELGLMHRTAGQIRDRFRVKFPQNYESNTILPITENPTEKDENSGKPEPKSSSDSQKPKARSNLDWLLHGDPMEDINDSFASLSKDFANHLPKDSSLNSVMAGTSEHLIIAGESVTATSTSTIEHTSNKSITVDSTAHQFPLGNIEASVEVDETRNLNIEELLNEDIEPLSQLPPLKFPFDQDWSGDAHDDSLTLAPLLWGGYDFTTGQWVGGMNG